MKMPCGFVQRMLLIIVEPKAIVQVLPIPVGDGSQRMVDLPQPFLGKVDLFGGLAHGVTGISISGASCVQRFDAVQIPRLKGGGL